MTITEVKFRRFINEGIAKFTGNEAGKALVAAGPKL